MYKTIPAKSFVQMLAANVDNAKLTDEAFREMVKNTLPHVEGGDLLVRDRVVAIPFSQLPASVTANNKS